MHNAVEHANGYRELSYGPSDLTGIDAWMWVFEISGDERVDYFFEDWTNTFGVLGSTPGVSLDELRATFRDVARSVRSTCR